MIVIFKNNANPEQVKQLCAGFEAQGLKIHNSEGEHTHLIGLIGDTSSVDIDLVRANDFVEDVKRVSEPYKKANRKFHPADTAVDVAGHTIGGGHFSVMAGPCSVESESQIVEVARDVQRSGAGILRGGAFKPRTSPYAFQGMRAEGLELLREARAATGLPIVTEIMNTEHVPLFADVDMIQVGARNMQNFELLKELGKLQTPVLLKRGLANTIEEFLMSAEYIMAGGNENVVLCERGIRTFETSMRNTLDISAVPMLKSKTHLPVVIDPSHAAGIAWMVEPLAMAAIAAGADGLMIEVHNDPPHAKSDGAQSLTPAQFDALMGKVKAASAFFGMHLLEHKVDTLRRGGERILVAGVRNPFDLGKNGTSPTLGLSPDDFVILLTHTPDYAEDVPVTNSDLILAGHTHGGQVTLFGLYAPIVPSHYGQRFLSGLKYNSKNIPMIVTNGIGTSQKAIRMFAPAEVVMIVLHRLTD